MNNASNRPCNLALSKRSLPRLGLLALVGLMTLAAAQLSSGTTIPTTTVQEVLPPTPAGTQPGGQMFLQATVIGSGSSEVTFYLGETPSYNGDDVEIGSTSTTASSGTVGVAGLVPQDVPPGFYYLLACIGSNCLASQGTVHIIDQSLSAVDQSLDTTVLAGPFLSISPKAHRAWWWKVRFLVQSQLTASFPAAVLGSRLNA